MEMDAWDVALLVAAGYVAVVELVRLMIRRRDQMLAEFRREMRAGKRAKRATETRSIGQHDEAA